MLKAAAMISVSILGVTGCLWEPVQQAPVPGNDDAAPVIQTALPDTNQILLQPSEGDLCVANVGLLSVYSPRGEPLQASFFLNFNLQTNAAPLSIDGQTRFDLQQSPQGGVYSLSPQQIHIDDFISQLNGEANLLQVFVSDDLVHCPNPLTVVPSSPSNDQTLACYTTSWVWVIEPNRCPIFENF